MVIKLFNLYIVILLFDKCLINEKNCKKAEPVTYFLFIGAKIIYAAANINRK